MRPKKTSFGFSMVDLVVVLCVVLVAFALLTPSIRQSQEENHLDTCRNKARALVLATLNHEAATTRFPVAMFGQQAAARISRRGPMPFGKADGYSWIVATLPYLAPPDTVRLYDELSEASSRFSLPMNAKQLQRDGKWIHAQPIQELVCPSVPAERSLVRGKYEGLGDAQVSNYLALASGCVDGSRQTYADLNPITGGMMVTKQASPKGLRIGACHDGTSKTLLIGESKAELYSFWFSGRSTTTVAMPPDLVQCSRILRNKGDDGFAEPKPNIPSAINYGRDRLAGDDVEDPWFAEGYPPAPQDWGISSYHEQGKVVHGYVDGHVTTFTKAVSPRVYFRATTRGGGEPNPIR